MTRRQKRFGARPEAAAERLAGGGLLHRRTLLTAGAVATGAIALNARTLPAVKMPNRDGFVSWWPLLGGE